MTSSWEKADDSCLTAVLQEDVNSTSFDAALIQLH